MAVDRVDQRQFFDLGHQGDVDYTQITHLLELTPTQRLDRHEGWRLFVKEALSRAALRQRHDPALGSGRS